MEGVRLLLFLHHENRRPADWYLPDVCLCAEYEDLDRTVAAAAPSLRVTVGVLCCTGTILG